MQKSKNIFKQVFFEEKKSWINLYSNLSNSVVTNNSDLTETINRVKERKRIMKRHLCHLSSSRL